MFEPPGPPVQEPPAAEGAPAVSGPPHWDSLTELITCPMCTYNLRGLVEPRCPECGYRFTWPDMLDARRRLHRYLFEHHPEKNLRSFLQTAFAGWLPRRFWTSLHPFQPSNPGRLIRYWACAVTVYALSLAASILAAAIIIANTNRIYNNQFRLTQSRSAPALATHPGSSSRPAQVRQPPVQLNPPSIPMIVRERLAPPFRRDGYCVTLALPIVWPWTTFATLMIFRLTMRRVGVRPIHALRCVLYSMDTPFWFGVLIIMISVGQTAIAIFSGVPYDPIEFLHAWPLVTLLLALIGCWRLWRAYKYYMQFDHPLATVVAAQFIVFLVVLISLALSGANI